MSGSQGQTPLLSSSHVDVREYLSPSRLNCWLRCPLAFQYRYVEGMRTPPTESLFLGKAVHVGLESYYRHRHLGMALSCDAVVDRLFHGWAHLVDDEGMQFDTANSELACQRQAAELIAAYLRHADPDETPLAVEVSLQVPLVDPSTDEDLGMPLLGILDLVLADASGPAIIDFKTTSRSSPPLDRLHEIQLTAYAWLFRHTTSAQEGSLQIRSLVKTKTPKIEIHTYPPRTDNHFHRFFAVVRAYLDAVDSGQFVYRPGLHCCFCDYRDGPCQAWPG